MYRLFFSILFALSVNNAFACEIVASWEPWPPFQIKKTDGTFTGLDLDILKLIDSEMSECSVKFVEKPWKRNLQEIQNGKVDLTAGVFKNPEREKFAFFSAPYRAETSFLYVTKKRKKSLSANNVADLVSLDFRLGTTRGYYYGEEFEAVKSNFSRVNHRAVTSESQLFSMFRRGRLDGIISTYFNAKSGMESVKVSNYVPAFKVHSADRFFMISKHITDIKLMAFNNALNHLIAAGEVQKIVNEYEN